MFRMASFNSGGYLSLLLPELLNSSIAFLRVMLPCFTIERNIHATFVKEYSRGQVQVSM